MKMRAWRVIDELQVELPPPDLGPTASLNQTLHLLQDVLSSHDSSIVPMEERKHDFQQVSGHVVVILAVYFWTFHFMRAQNAELMTFLSYNNLLFNRYLYKTIFQWQKGIQRSELVHYVINMCAYPSLIILQIHRLLVVWLSLWYKWVQYQQAD